MVYVGPTVPRTHLSHLTIYADGVPQFVIDEIKRSNVKGAHFVSISEYAANPGAFRETGPMGFRVTPIRLSPVTQSVRRRVR
jgi:hypothetical protein